MNQRDELAGALGEEISPDEQVKTPPPPEDTGEEEESVGSREESGKSDINLESFTLQDLLKHPKLSGELKSWADTEAARQLKGKTDEIRRSIRPEVRAEIESQVADETLRKYFANMDEDELGRTLAENKDLAAEYGRLQQEERQKQSQPDMMAAMVHGYAIQIATWDRMRNESELPDAVKAELDPDRFDLASKGEAGLVEWGQAIQQALIVNEVEKRVNSITDDKWEAFLQERQAKEDEGRVGRPVMSKGTRQAPVPDLMENSSYDLLEHALRNGKKG